MTTDLSFRTMTPADWEAVAEIYLQGIAGGEATFQQQAPSAENWDKGHLPFCRILAIDSRGAIMGWCALSPVSTRPVYAGVAEVSIYIHPACQGQQTGSRLLAELVRNSEEEGIWTLQAGIFPENKSSLRIHEKNGFRIVGRRERIGQMNGVWRDTLLLERRSSRVS